MVVIHGVLHKQRYRLSSIIQRYKLAEAHYNLSRDGICYNYSN